ncbi:MAG: tetratricopeptide repeat protein [Deltaproteobacteria bacterium]|nr:tetratricopeptide repeat protein [Deltaproteobacteria bacterium]
MKFYTAGEALYQKGDYEKAARNFANAATIDPTFAKAYEMLGLSLYKMTRIREAYGAFQKATELNKELYDAQTHLGKILLMSGKNDESLAKADLVLAKKPDDGEALLLKSASLASLGRANEARVILEALIAKEPKKTDAYFLLSKVEMQGNNDVAAEKTLRKLLDYDQKNIAARLFIAQILEKNKKFNDTEKEYKEIINIASKDDRYRLLLAGFYERTGRTKEGERMLKELIDRNPDKKEYRLYLANYYRERKQEGEMVQVLKKTITDLPQQYEPYQMLALYEVEKKQKDRAFQLMEEYMGAAPQGPEHLKAKLFLAALHFQDRRVPEAKQLVEEVLKENPRDVIAHRIKGDILLAEKDFIGAISEFRLLRQEIPDDLRATLSLARAHLLNNEPSSGEDMYKNALKIDPSSREAYNALSDIAVMKKDYDLAEKYADALIQSDSKSPYPYYKKGIIKALQGKDGEASALFEKSLAMNPDYMPAMVRIAALSTQKKKDIQGAIARVESQIGRSANNDDYTLLLAELHVMNKEPSKASKVLDEALKKRPGNVKFLVGLADLERITGRNDKAIASYEKILASYPDNASVSLKLASLYEQKGDLKRAGNLYEEMAAKNKDDAIAANNLAFFYAEHAPSPENLAEAEQMFKPFFEKNLGVPAFADTMAWIYFKTGDYEKARDILEKAFSGDQKIPSAVSYHMGMTMLRLGNKEKAKDYLAKALAGGEKFPGRGDGEKALKEIK